MDAEQIGALVTRLIGDPSNFVQAMDEAKSSAQSTVKSIGGSAKQIEDFQKSLNRFATGALSTLGFFGAATSLKGAFEAFTGYEKGVIRLNAALEANGTNVPAVTEQYDHFAASVTASTLATKGQTMSMLTQAAAYGITGDAAERVVSNSIALAGATGGEAQGMLRVAVALEQGNMALVKRVLRLQGVKSESELAATIQQRLASGLKMAEAEAETTAGKIAKLQRSLGGLSRDVGALVADAILPLVEQLQAAADYFNDLEPSVKRTTVVVVALLAGLVAFKPALIALGPAISLVKGALTTILSVMGLFASYWGLILIPAIVVIAIIVQQLGGIAKTWELVKEAAFKAWGYIQERIAAFMVWARPITQALKSLWNAVWEGVTNAALQVWEWIKEGWKATVDFLSEVWQEITGDALPTWEEIRDAIQRVIIGIEFGIRNLPDVFNFVWTAIKLATVAAANFILNNAFLMMLGPTAGLAYLLYETYDVWKDVFKGMWDYAKEVFKQLIENVRDSFAAMWESIKNGGEAIDWDGVWKDFRGSFDVTMRGFKVPKLDALEEDLRRQLAEQGAALGEGFEEFYAQKIAEFAGDIPQDQIDKMKDKTKKLGTGLGNAMKEGLVSAKFDAVLISSAEALTRLAEFKDRLELGKGGAQAKFDAVASGSNEAMSRERNMLDVMKDVRDGVRELVKKPGLEIDPAGLEG